tara:strand:- start:460945 stop:461532 length:588 start_codon:yes stop_codon:yes gene_type:complete
MRTTTKNTIAENGFSLIEVLVALFVLAVGVIGAVAMQLTALRTTQQTDIRTQALHLASEMADSMSSKPMQILLEEGRLPFLLNHDEKFDAASTKVGNCFLTDSPCDAEQLAHFNLKEWSLRLQKTVPGGRAHICRDAAIWNKDIDQINWSCDDTSTKSPLFIKIAWRQKSQNNDSGEDLDSTLTVIALSVSSYPR